MEGRPPLQLSDEEALRITEAVVTGLTRGQGSFDDLDLAAACASMSEMVIGQSIAELVFEEKLSIVVDRGVVKYAAI